MVYPCSGSAAQTRERGEAKAAAPLCFRVVAMPQQQPEAKCLYILTESPAGWPLATVIDAFGELAADTACNPGRANVALEAVSRRLVQLWASQPAEAEAWLQRCRERFATELACKVTRPELLSEALLQHGAAEFDKYGWGHWRFSEAELLREPRGSAAVREVEAARYLQDPYTRARCRELGERLRQAESQETARKRQKLEETSERRHLEAELHKSQEEGRELRNRLAAAEVEVCSKAADLQSAQSESAGYKEQCKELEHRAKSAESLVAEMREELQKVQDEHCKCQKLCEDLANRLEAAVAEHAEAKERLAHDTAEKLLDLQQEQQQDQSCSCQACCFPISGEELSKAELQLEKAVLQERCEQLRQQLAKAEAKVDLLQGLREEIGMYKERLRVLELERPVVEAKKSHRLGGGIPGHLTPKHHGPAPGDVLENQDPDLAEELGYSFVVDEDSTSVRSGSSVSLVKENCFMLDAIFKSRMDFYCEGRDLQKGSQVLAGDGKTVLEVVEISKEGRAAEVVDLRAGTATLRVTPDHPVHVPNEGGEAGRQQVEGGRLCDDRLGKAGCDHKCRGAGHGVQGLEDRLQARLAGSRLLQPILHPQQGTQEEIAGAPQWHGRERQGLGGSDGWRSLDSRHGGRGVHGLSLYTSTARCAKAVPRAHEFAEFRNFSSS
ncbi:unnamed protein product [Symbiodinium sp. CCMP2456]|nr:unnamed protein product [Symbiodinium sp. CCMP2456]